MAHDVFVSYSSSDRPWAVALDRALSADGLRVFRDDRLDAGKPWESALSQAVEDAQHLVVIWSKAAKNSTWVSREIAEFEARHPKREANRVVFVHLDNTVSAYSSIQAVFELVPLAGTDPPSVTSQEWFDAYARISTALRADANAVGIPLICLTLTSSEVADIRTREWENVEASVGLGRGELAARYEGTREDWKPLDGKRTIAQLLQSLAADLNAAAAPTRFRWEHAPRSFWSGNPENEANAFIRGFAAAPLSLLIIDPIIIHVDWGYRQLMQLQDCTTNRQMVISVLPPFPADDRYVALRDSLRKQASPYFNHYFDPLSKLRPGTSVPLLAQFGLPARDECDLKRLLATPVVRFLSRDVADAKSEFLRV